MNIAPGPSADFIAGTLPELSTLLRQELIETSNVRKRLEMLIRELPRTEFWSFGARSTSSSEQVSRTSANTSARTNEGIQKELGEIDDAQLKLTNA